MQGGLRALQRRLEEPVGVREDPRASWQEAAVQVAAQLRGHHARVDRVRHHAAVCTQVTNVSIIS